MRPPTLVLCAVLLCPGASSWNSSTVWGQTTGAKPDLAVGKKLFQEHCSACHGMEGGGGRGPSLHTPTLKHASDENGLRALIGNGISPQMPPAWYLTEDEVASVAGYVLTLGSVPREKVPGDATRGAALYAQANCGMCHTLAGQGSSVGPDLTEVGARRGATQLRQTLQHPDRTIPDGFLLVEAILPSGDVIRGVRMNEDSFSIQIRDLSGRFYSNDTRNMGADRTFTVTLTTLFLTIGDIISVTDGTDTDCPHLAIFRRYSTFTSGRAG